MFSTTALPCPEVLDLLYRRSLSDKRQIYLVGGAVRDLLLNRTTKDLDIVVEGEVKPFARQVANTLGGEFFMLDDERDMARVIILAGSDKSVELDFSPITSGNIEEDLRSRDFTINAMALNVSDLQHLIDPMGGAQDLLDKILSTCSDLAILNDPIRILRAIRFGVEFGLKISPRLMKQLRDAVSSLNNVSIERQRDELFKVFQGKDPGLAIRLFDRIDILKGILPELELIKHIEQAPPHTYNVWEHTLNTLDELTNITNHLVIDKGENSTENLKMAIISKELGIFRTEINRHLSGWINPNRSFKSLLVFSALYHDTGKTGRQGMDPENRGQFLEHEKFGSQLVLKRSGELKLNLAERTHLQTLVKNHMRIHWLANEKSLPSRKSVYRFFNQTGETGIDICLLSLADTLATYGPALPEEKLDLEARVCRRLFDAKWRDENSILSPEKLIDGLDLQNEFQMKPGPEIGVILEEIREAQAAGELKERKDVLYFVERWLKENDH